MIHNNSDDVARDEQPPMFGSWRKLYLTVIINLVVLIVLFYFFSKAFT
jgi:hypothetical protein